MEHDDRNADRWVDDRMASLDPPGNWRPDSSAALARLYQRDGTAKAPRRHRWWLWATVSASAVAGCIVFLLISTPPACANPLGCTQPSQPAPVAPDASPDPAPGPVVAATAHPAMRAPEVNFKESGSPTAPLTCEVYTDYECPHCATFYLETIPPLVAGYVDTGKVRLIHRDFPLSQHPYARLAARYANAAGENGYYQATATRLFRTQAVWSGDGNIDQQVAQVVPAAVMEKVRALVKNGAALDKSVAADEAMARGDYLSQTPTVVLVSRGDRHVMTGFLTFTQLKKYVDELLAQQ